MARKPRGNPNWAKDPETGKGKSGNPGGRPAVAKEVRAWIEARTQQAAERLFQIIEHGDDKVAVQAIKIALEFGLGKPATVDPNGEVVRDEVITVVIPEALQRA